MSKYKITKEPGEYTKDYVVRRKQWDFWIIPYVDWCFISSAETFEDAVKVIERDKKEQQLQKVKPTTWYVQ